MTNHYMLYENMQSGEQIYLAEFAQLETAMDFVEAYHQKFPGKALMLRGGSYNRTQLTEGTVISTWDAELAAD